MKSGLVDGFGRTIDYLRLSITDRCDLRCRYCLPDGFCDFATVASRLSAAEIERLVRAFASLGVRRVRLTGGEPLTRADLPEIARRIAAIPGVEDLSLSTNGTLLARHAKSLRDAGVQRLNVSLDTLRREHFRTIAGRDVLDQVLAGLAAARAAGFRPIKLNTVVLPDSADDEIDEIAEFARSSGFILRLIETMPIGPTGRGAGFRPLASLADRLGRRYDLIPGLVHGGGPARYLVSRDGRFSIGFITAVSQHFCESCNRVRVAADGRLQLCLGDEASADLRSELQAGRSATELCGTIREAIRTKPRRHEFQARSRKIMRFMAQTGG